MTFKQFFKDSYLKVLPNLLIAISAVFLGQLLGGHQPLKEIIITTVIFIVGIAIPLLYILPIYIAYRIKKREATKIIQKATSSIQKILNDLPKEDDTVELLVSENRTFSKERIDLNCNLLIKNVIRVFVNRDFTYGYWVPENIVVGLLTPEQQLQYFTDQSYSGGTFKISRSIAREIIKAGSTPYNKQVL